MNSSDGEDVRLQVEQRCSTYFVGLWVPILPHNHVTHAPFYNKFTVTRKGDATHIWKVADVEFLYLSTKSKYCLGVKSKLVARKYVYNKIYRKRSEERRVGKECVP